MIKYLCMYKDSREKRMKHVFILNPASGKGDGAEKLKSGLLALDCDYEVHETTGHLDATEFVRDYCKNYKGDVRFYACGGDGTIKEVADGIIGYKNASMSVYPIGSGNDFVRYFGGAESFLNLAAITSAEDAPTDMIKISLGDGRVESSVNVANFGFEACAANIMDKVRRKPIIGGKNSYTTGIIGAIFKAMKNHGKIYADGELINPKGTFILCTAANGSFVGGGYKCAPRASVNDGYLEVCMIRPVSIITLARLIGVYKVGGHLDDKRFQKYLVYRRVKKLEVKADRPFPLALDGECFETTSLVAEVVEGAIRFAAPSEKEAAIVK